MTVHRAATADGLAEAAALLRGGALVAFPTETVYGLGANARDPAAIAALYAAKGRPSHNPLIAHVPDRRAAERVGTLSATAIRLADAFWPGPLTLVVPRAPGGGLCDAACAGLPSVGLRVPAHPVARALLAAVDAPVAAPSANRSGRVSPTTATHVAAELDGRIAMILDGGPCTVGVESTILSCLQDVPVLLRPGGVPREAIEAMLGGPLATLAGAAPARPLAPGLLASHYAPAARARLGATAVEAGEAVLDFAGRLRALQVTGPYRDLSPTGDLAEAASRLFDALRALDAAGAATIAVAPIPDQGLGAALNDRLGRAAAPRP